MTTRSCKRHAGALLRTVALVAPLIALGACSARVEPSAPAGAARHAGAVRTLPATAWAPQAPYSEARLSPFDPVRLAVRQGA